ncbi:hypothetical protein CDL15_Pgr019327 [Punica granatum]|uniref:Cytochrome c-553 n=1 Tax=Punica granatum TaxID=22663 RepID=A0A218X5H2_PUNGR|nr:hypothetical protein CDL15_Pgr019327 [Punica granatum]
MAPSATAVHLGRPLPCRFTAVKSRHLSTPTQPVSRPAPSPASGKWKRDYTSTTNAPPTGAGSSIRGCVRDALPVVRARSSVVHCLASCPNANTAAMQVGVTRKPKLQVELFKALASPLMAAIVALSSLCNPPVSLGQTVDIQRGVALFQRACIGCHDAGGNIIQPGATLFMKDLQRYRASYE